MHALELARVEAAFQVFHGFAQDEGLVGCGEAHIVAGGVDFFDGIDVDAEDLALILHIDDALETVGCGLGCGDEGGDMFGIDFGEARGHALGVFAQAAFGEPRADALHGLGEAFRFHRLHQIVHRLRLERADGVIGIGGHEHEQGWFDIGKGGNHGKAIEAGHLHIEKHHVGLFGADQPDGFAAIAGAADNFHIGKGFQAQRKALHGERLVIDEQCSNCHWATS